MFDIALFFIFQNIFFLMIIFWALSWLGEKLYKIKYYNNSNEIYECGFLTFHNIKIEFNLNFVIIAFLLILYDIEFFFLIPVFFNINNPTIISFIILWLFLVFIISSLILEWNSDALDWIG